MGSNNTDPEMEHAASQFEWRINEADIRPLPEIYPKMTNPLIMDGISVEQLAARLSKFMKVNSIGYKYECHRARAICCTSHVSFVVQLWRDRNDENSKKIVLEVTRRYGCSIMMHKIRTALSQSLQSDGHPILYEDLISQSNDLKISPRIKRKCEMESRHARKKKFDVPRSLCQRKELENTIDLLQSDAYDEQDHGISNLAFLTDPTKVPREEALQLAKLLIFRENIPSDMGSRLQNSLEDFVYGLDVLRPRVIDESPIHDLLAALTNAMELLSEDCDETTLTALRKEASDMLCVFWRHMAQFVINRILSFQEFPESAALAVKCLRLWAELAESSGDNSKEANSHCRQLLGPLHEAYKHGKSCNALLEEEASKLCKFLGEPKCSK
ncbi:MAG: hypothetical protein SGILL_006469 [Bacillariaceae sp.]